MSLVCPICQKDDKFEKVSSVFDTEEKTGTYHGPATTVAYTDGKYQVGSSWVSGTTNVSSQLGRKLSPPTKPSPPSYSWLFYLGLIIGVPSGLCAVINFIIMPGKSIRMEDGFWIVVIGTILGIALIVYDRNKRNQKVPNYQEELNTWQIKMTEWNRWYYCRRDDIIFDPQTGDVYEFQRF